MTTGLRKFMVGAAMLAGAFTIISALNPSDPLAQLRAALTKNVDEPGRTPWETRSQFLPGSGCFGVSDCYNGFSGSTFARFELRAVPAGKRWVVQTATGGFTNAIGRITQIQLVSPPFGGVVFDGLKWSFAGPFFAGTPFASAIFNANLFTTFGPGETPGVRIDGSPSLSGYFVVTFSGYLIDAAN